MDLQDQPGSNITPASQEAVVASIYPSLEQWTSTSFQTPTHQEIMSISSLIPSTFHTLMPHVGPATPGQLYPLLPSFPQVTPDPQLPEISSSSSGSSVLPADAQDPNATPSSSSPKENPQLVQQTTPLDGSQLDVGSVGLTLVKDPDDVEPGNYSTKVFLFF